MTAAGGLLPEHGIELKWVRNQPLVPKILSKVSMSYYNARFEYKCTGRFIPGFETNGMVVSHQP